MSYHQRPSRGLSTTELSCVACQGLLIEGLPVTFVALLLPASALGSTHGLLRRSPSPRGAALHQYALSLES